jgi:hypothetical protein
MRCAIDTGGTFTDLALEHEGEVRIFKCPTTPADPIVGILDVLELDAPATEKLRAELAERAPEPPDSLDVEAQTQAIADRLAGYVCPGGAS